MKTNAIVLKEFGDPKSGFSLEEIDLPELKANQVLVEMKASPVNPADINLIEGKYGILPDLPTVPGNEGVGIIKETGANVSDYSMGDIVIFPNQVGAWCEHRICDSEYLINVKKSFEPLEGFKLPHFGRFWDRIQQQYQHCEHASPLLQTVPENEFPWPRVWLLNGNKTSLIQIQRNCFLFNWRRVTGDEAYPRYSNVVKEFLTQLNGFRTFLNEQSLPQPKINQCELTYINHIPIGEIWQTPAELGKIAPDLKWRDVKRFLPSPESSAWTGVFMLPEDFGRLTVSVKHAQRKIDGNPLYVLEFSAKGLGGDGGDNGIQKWFDLAHEWIVRGFCDFTDIQIQRKFWGRKDS